MKNRILTFITAITILLFCSTSLIAQQTKINFNKSGEPVFQTTTSNIDSVVFEQLKDLYLVNISEETDFDYMVLGRDGSSMFFNVDEDTDIPTLMCLKPFTNSDIHYTFLFKENGLLDKMVFDDHIMYFDNFRENKFDVAVIYPDKTIEYFHDINSDVDWDDFLNASKTQKGIIQKGLKVLSNVVGVGTCVSTFFFPPAGVWCAGFVITTVGHQLADLIPINPVSDVAHVLVDVIGCAGAKKDPNTWTACISAFAGAVSLLSYLDIQNILANAASINEAKIYLNRYAGITSYLDANGNAQTVPDSVLVLLYDGRPSLGAADSITWVLVSGTQVADGRITILGDVRLILADSCILNASNGGINVAGSNKLTIYAQSVGINVGILTAKGSTRNAGIGGNTNEPGGIITINGGRVTSTGANGSGTDGGGAGIGGGGGQHNTHDNGGNGGNITINGGTVTSTGGKAGDGTKGGTSAGYGGGGAGAGIGGGGGCGRGRAQQGAVGGDGGIITINGGTVTSTGGKLGYGAGGGGFAGSGGGAGGGAGASIGGGGGGGAGGRGAGTSGNGGYNGSDTNAIGSGGNGGTGGGNGIANDHPMSGGAGGAGANYINNGGTVITQ